MQRKIFIAGILFFLTWCLYPKYHPEIKWREIKGKDNKFYVVYPLGYEEEARYTLNKAGEFYQKLQTLWGMDVKGKIKILLTDSYDVYNGNATFFPFNRIELYLFSPPPDSTLGDYTDWIDLALSHEMNHIFNMNAGSGITYFMRKIMGTNPLFYPMIYTPLWMQEGLSVYVESQLNPGGRLNAPDYKIMLDRLASARLLAPPGSIYGEPTDWPGPSAKYFYGAAFIQYLAGQYGEDKVGELVRHFARVPIPLFITGRSTPFGLTISKQFRNIFKKDLSTLWAEFTGSVAINPSDLDKVAVLTDSGVDKQYPTAGDKNTVFYVESNYKEYPGIYRLDLKTGKSKRLNNKSGINGMFYHAYTRKLYFSAADYYKTFYTYSDIYVMDTSSGKVKQLSKGRRLFHPVTNGKTLVCIKREGVSSYLAHLDLKGGKETVLSSGFSALAYPAISPDGKRVAVSVKRKNESWRIGLFTDRGKFTRFLTSGDVKSYYPLWKKTNELYFITEHNDHYRLACVKVDTGNVSVHDDARLPSLRYFSFLRGGGGQMEAVISFFDAGGLNLGRVDLSKLESLEREEAVPPPGDPDLPAIPGNSTLKAGKYNFLGDLMPKYFTPYYRSGGDDFQPGIYFSGTDILGEHSFEFEGYYGLKTDSFNWAFDYTFDGFYPTLRFRYRDFTDLHRGSSGVEYDYRTREMEFIGMVPLIARRKSRAWWYSNIYFERVNTNFGGVGEGEELNLNGVKVGILFSSAKRYYDSFSLSDGVRLALSYSRDLKFLGSDYETNAAALEYKQYLTIFRPNVLALRFVVSDSWGEAKRRVFLGGMESYEGYVLAGDSMFELMRGYPSGYFSGTGGYLLNVEYRVGLMKIERPFLFSRGVERLYLNIFADIGNLWEEERRIEPAVSLGAELNLSTLFGDFRYIFSLGAAVGQNPFHKTVFYLRIGSSF